MKQHEFVQKRAQAHAAATRDIASDYLVQAAMTARAADLEVKAAMAVRAAARARKSDSGQVVVEISTAPAGSFRRQAG